MLFTCKLLVEIWHYYVLFIFKLLNETRCVLLFASSIRFRNIQNLPESYHSQLGFRFEDLIIIEVIIFFQVLFHNSQLILKFNYTDSFRPLSVVAYQAATKNQIE